MYIILVYDIGQKRLPRMLKLCRQYLNWIQNSVFEGELTNSQLTALLHKAQTIMDPTHDSLIYFKSKDEKWLEKVIVGVEKQATDVFL